jgi:hypothetical protein
MKQHSLWTLALLSALPALALDEKPLLSQGSMETSLTAKADGAFQALDQDWNMYSIPTPSAPMRWGMTAGFKYGMNDQSDLEIVLPWELRDADWSQQQGRSHHYYTGFDRMDLSAKIQVRKLGFGPLAGFSFPLGNTKVIGYEPEWGFTFGGWGGYHKGNRWIDGLATWSITPENSSGLKPGSSQNLLLTAGIQLDEGVAPTFGFQWQRQAAGSLNGSTKGLSQWQSEEHQSGTLIPGCVLQLDEDWNLETKVPVVYSGRNAFATVGLSLTLVGNFEP